MFLILAIVFLAASTAFLQPKRRRNLAATLAMLALILLPIAADAQSCNCNQSLVQQVIQAPQYQVQQVVAPVFQPLQIQRVQIQPNYQVQQIQQVQQVVQHQRVAAIVQPVVQRQVAAFVQPRSLISVNVGGGIFRPRANIVVR